MLGTLSEVDCYASDISLSLSLALLLFRSLSLLLFVFLPKSHYKMTIRIPVLPSWNEWKMSFKTISNVIQFHAFVLNNIHIEIFPLCPLHLSFHFIWRHTHTLYCRKYVKWENRNAQKFKWNCSILHPISERVAAHRSSIQTILNRNQTAMNPRNFINTPYSKEAAAAAAGEKKKINIKRLKGLESGMCVWALRSMLSLPLVLDRLHAYSSGLTLR